MFLQTRIQIVVPAFAVVAWLLYQNMFIVTVISNIQTSGL